MMRIRKTYFHPLWPENSVDIEFECSEKDFYLMMKLERCKYDEEFYVWYTEDDRGCYAIIG